MVNFERTGGSPPPCLPLKNPSNFIRGHSFPDALLVSVNDFILFASFFRYYVVLS